MTDKHILHEVTVSSEKQVLHTNSHQMIFISCTPAPSTNTDVANSTLSDQRTWRCAPDYLAGSTCTPV